MYEFVGAVCNLTNQRARYVQLYRSNAIDCAVGLPGDIWLGVMVRSYDVGSRQFYERLKFALRPSDRLNRTFLLVEDFPQFTDSPHLVARRYVDKPSPYIGVAHMAGDVDTPHWTRYGNLNDQANLRQLMEPLRQPMPESLISESPSRTSLPRPPVQEGYTRATMPRDNMPRETPLTPGQWSMLRTVASWPRADEAALVTLCEGLKKGHARNVLRELQRMELVMRVESERSARPLERYLLTHKGISLIAHNARMKVGRARDLMSAQIKSDGKVRGSILRNLQAAPLHTEMIYEVASVFKDTADKMQVGSTHEPPIIRQMLPTHRGRRYVTTPQGRLKQALEPDLTIKLDTGWKPRLGEPPRPWDLHVLLIEVGASGGVRECH